MENFEKQFNQPKPPEEAKNPELKQETPPDTEFSQKPPENLNESTENKTKNQEKSENQDKDLKLERIRQEVDTIKDAKGRGIDEGIKETVVMFQANELPTSDSCEGHIDENGLRPPHVEVKAPNRPERWEGVDGALEKIQPLKETDNDKFHQEHEKIMQEFSKKTETSEYQKWEEENKKLTEKSRGLLDEFYKNRDVESDAKLQIEEEVEENPRIYSGGKDSWTIIEDLEKGISEDEKKMGPEKLEKYRQEMKEFTDFLKEKYLKENPARHNPETKTEKKKTSSGLYDVKEVEGGFEVVFPGLFDKKREVIVGTSKQHFETREEAEQAAERAQEGAKELFERASLEKTFTKYFYRIDETQDGKFRVVLPGLIDSKTGYYVGTTHKDFESWQQAKEYFLQQRESEEKLTQKPLLEIQTSENEKIAFSDLDSFNPRIAPSEKSHKIPTSIERYLLGKEKLAADAERGASTYQETIKEKGWETKLFDFTSSYLKKEGAKITKELKIENLDALTPKQAIELATQIVIDLTKYKESDARKQKESKPDEKLEKTKADQSTVLQLLQEGLIKRNQSGWDEKNPIWDKEWEGNGVCRNFASSVKAVFEALKENQTKFGQLRDTYCLYESGAETFAPKRERKNVLELSKTGHAWNTFVTISKEGAANAVIIDTTWAKRNLETKKVEGLDYTLTRMEPVVNAIGQGLQETAPDKEEQLKHILSFYMLKMEKPGDTGGHASPEEEKQFYATRVLELMTKQGVPQELPKPLVEAIGQEYLKIAGDADSTEIETIYKMSQNNPDLDFRGVLKSYLKNKEFSGHADALMFKNDNVQKLAFEELKFRKDFDKFIKKNLQFRVRMREALPELFMGFSPAIKQEDRNELLYLMDNSQLLRWEKSRIGKTEEELKDFFIKKREFLRTINPQKYDENIAGLDDYQLLKQFDRINGELKT